MPQEDLLRREYLVHVAHLGSQLLEAELSGVKVGGQNPPLHDLGARELAEGWQG